jgi:hypothetical protein
MQTPPHSARIPSTPFFSAAPITVVPTGASTSVDTPAADTYITFGINEPLIYECEFVPQA